MEKNVRNSYSEILGRGRIVCLCIYIFIGSCLVMVKEGISSEVEILKRTMITGGRSLEGIRPDVSCCQL